MARADCGIAALTLALALACSKPAHTPATALGMPGEWSYDVEETAGAVLLHVRATFSAGTSTRLLIVGGAAAFVRDFEAYEGARRMAVRRDGAAWILETCEHGCSVRYTFALREAGESFDDRERAFTSGDSVQAPPSTFLVRPLDAPKATRVTLDVTTAPGDAFACGLPRGPTPGTYVFATHDLVALPYAAIGRLRVHEIGDDVTLAELAPPILDDDAIVAWATDDARAFRDYYGGIPTSRVLVIANPQSGSGAGFGSTTGGEGAAIIVNIGRDSTREMLHGNWTLVHELVHTALPNLANEHRWLEEGLASYVEPFVRARAGLVTPQVVWRAFVRGLPFGLPERGDLGLDRTPTWGRTYWGGALFCFVADLEIRERTGGRKGLEDALRGIVAAGGTIKTSWPIERVLAAGDAATGLTVLRDLYAKWARAPVPVDLDAIWKRLGVLGSPENITFDDRAPLAAIRIAMTQPLGPR